MEGLRRGKGICLLVGIIVTFGFLVSGNVANAQDDLFFYATLLQGQNTGSQGFSSTTTYGGSAIVVTSIGNNTLSASLSMTSKQAGIWTLFLLGTGGRTFADLVVGVAPFGGPQAAIDIGPISFGLAVGNIIILDPATPVDVDSPLKWNMTVTAAGS